MGKKQHHGQSTTKQCMMVDLEQGKARGSAQKRRNALRTVLWRKTALVVSQSTISLLPSSPWRFT
jgi:hypothetical protein